MGIVVYLEEAIPWHHFGKSNFDPPKDEDILLFKALFYKMEAFKVKAQCIIDCNDISFDKEVQYPAFSMRWGSAKYFCDKYHELRLNLYGCFIELLKNLPNNTLLMRNTNGDNMNMLIIQSINALATLSYYGEEDRDAFNILAHETLHLSDEKDWDAFYVLSHEILHLCSEKNIYVDLNPYHDILIFKEPVETWINTTDYTKMRYVFTKYEDTYVDGHLDYHEETTPVEIREKTLISRKSFWIDRKSTKIYETYSVTYADGVIGQIEEEYIERD